MPNSRSLQCPRVGHRDDNVLSLALHRSWPPAGQLDELDVEGILAFAERVLPCAADLWVQASLEQRQRFQQLFFPEDRVRRKKLC